MARNFRVSTELETVDMARWVDLPAQHHGPSQNADKSGLAGEAFY